MECGVGDASPTTPGTPMETAHTKGVQNGDAAAAIEPEPSKNENESIEAPFEWTSDNLESLRLCRNRAYHKVNSKRRQHLPASISSYLLKEWQAMRPDAPKMDGKQLLAAYNENFEQVDRDRKRGRKRKEPTTETALSHYDKRWTPELLDRLVECGEVVDRMVQEGEGGDEESSSKLLLQEWKKQYPNSTMTSRNLRSKLNACRKTSETEKGKLPVPKRRRTAVVAAEDAVSKDSALSADEDRLIIDSASEDIRQGFPDEVCDEFAPEESYTPAPPSPGKGRPSRRGKEDSFGPASPVGAAPVIDFKWACPKHWVHMFSDPDKEIECIWTDRLLQMRDRIQDQFPGADLTLFKKPKGFADAVLKAWKKAYPRSTENDKSIVLKFCKYDREHIENAARAQEAPANSSMWTESLLESLLQSRKLAEEKAGPSPTSHMLTRIWKKTWKSLNPDVDCDWKVVVSRYNFHFADARVAELADLVRINSSGSCSSNGSDSTKNQKDASATNCARDVEKDTTEDNVKGFRTWTSKAKLDLLETKFRITADKPELEPGSAQFNRLLLQEFQKLHPKCMESSRSIYAKVQSIEKERVKSVKVEQNGDESGEESGREEADNKTPVVPRQEADVEAEVQGEGEETENISPDDFSQCEKVESVATVPAEIEGFEGWSLPMIKDFISCMDAARKKFAMLKKATDGAGAGGSGGVKLVPLLLDQWKELYPETTETVQTFLGKIKHLKQQKDIIKKHLEQSSLLPKGGDFEECGTSGAPSNRRRSKQSGSEGDNNGFKWNKSMLPDVVKSRRRAIQRKGEALARGKKLSFHSLWADEFRKLHPLSTFTSNNLSVHFWSWRKQQQKLGKDDPMLDDALAESPPKKCTLRNSGPPPSRVFLQQQQHQQPQLHPSSGSVSNHRGSHSSVWTIESKRDLLKIGKDIKARLGQHVPGFANLLHSAWKRDYPGRSDTARGLNTMFHRLIKNGITGYDALEDRRRLKFRWTPAHNRALRECVAGEDAKASAMSAKQQQQQQAYYTQRIVDAWRKRFPTLEVSMESMMPRLSDVIEKRNIAASAVLKGAQSKSADDPQSRSQSRANSLEMAEDAYRRGPTSRGQMNWNQITVSDLLNAYDTARAESRAGDLRETLRKGFTKFNPHCRLSSAVLLAKALEWREREKCGEFSRTPPTITALKVEHDVKSETVAKADNEESEVGGGNGNASIVYRTWSKEMIDSMVKTRRIAIEKKKRMGIASRKSFQLVDLWHTEFTAMHPDFKCTKRNLLRKYNWYRNRNKFPDAADGGGDENGDRSAAPSAADVKREEEAKKAVQVGNIIRIKAIRKDIFLHVKSLMEESRIFLPLKLPVEAELKPEFVSSPLNLPMTTSSQQYQSIQQIPQFVPQSPVHHQPQPPPPPQMQLNLDRASASQTLVHLHQKAMQENLRGLGQPPPPPVMAAPMPPLPPNVTLPTHITVTPQPLEDEEREKKETIKLPGGATLVAVTERNSVGLLKPKPMEKPHVTITIGNKNRDSPLEDQSNLGSGDLSPIDMTKTANLEPPHQPIILPINVPRFPLPSQPLPPLPPPPAHQQPLHQQPMPQLTYVTLPAHVTPKAIFIPSRVKAKIDEVGLNDRDFIQLLEVYEKARSDYIDTLKRGYLAFFPYVLGGIWRREATDGGINGAVYGRKLQDVVELYVEEKNKGKFTTPEYLTKKACNFHVTEELLKQILILHAEIEKSALMEAAAEDSSVQPNPAVMNVEMCRKWAERYPEAKMTNKQLISIHEMLNYDQHQVGDDAASPEVACALSDIWKTMDNLVPASEIPATADFGGAPLTAAPSPTPECPRYCDNSNLSMDDIVTFVTQTSGLKSLTEKVKRPRYAVKNLRRFWSDERVSDLCESVREAGRKWRNRGRRCRRPFVEMVHKEWLRRRCEDTADRRHVLGKVIWLIRREKRIRQSEFEKTAEEWRALAKDYIRSEGGVQVLDEEEEAKQASKESDLLLGGAVTDSANGDAKQPLVSRLTSLSSISSIKMASNANRNFHNDADVLEYIEEIQHLGNKQPANLTWTPEVIGDLIEARRRARKRKAKWEEWAVGEYGSVGAAYLFPEANYTKLDDLLKEEWCKLRPDMATLSAWTLTAYARRFDNLKKQLIADNDQGHLSPAAVKSEPLDELETEKRPWQKTIYYKSSCIPKFDLGALEKLAMVSAEVKALVRSRQLAKERQRVSSDTGSKLSLISLWEEEWKKMCGGDPTPGPELQRKLYMFESQEENVALLKPALFRMSEIKSEIKEENGNEEPSGEIAGPEHSADDFPHIMPRPDVYPDYEVMKKKKSSSQPPDEEFNAVCEVYIKHPRGGHKVKKLVNLQRDYFPGRSRLGLPAVEKECNIIDDDYLEDEDFYFEIEEDEGRIVMDAKARLICRADPALVSYGDPSAANAQPSFSEGKFACDYCEQLPEYSNVNNYAYHTNTHAL